MHVSAIKLHWSHHGEWCCDIYYRLSDDGNNEFCARAFGKYWWTALWNGWFSAREQANYLAIDAKRPKGELKLPRPTKTYKDEYEQSE